MDYQQDPAQIKIPWGKIIGVNVAITVIVAFLFNLLFSFIMPSSVFTRLKEVEKRTSDLQSNMDKLFGRIKIGN